MHFKLFNSISEGGLIQPNVFGVIFLAPPEKILKSTVFELEQWFLHQNVPFFHQEFNGKGLWVLGSQFCTK